MTFFEKARNMLDVEEGVRTTLYYCTAGQPTIGRGHNLKVPISEAAVEQIFSDDLAAAEEAAMRVFGDKWFELPDLVALGVVNMIFQLGENGFLGFVRTVDALRSGEYKKAADYALQSKWAKQTPARALRVAKLFRGEDPYGQ